MACMVPFFLGFLLFLLILSLSAFFKAARTEEKTRRLEKDLGKLKKRLERLRREMPEAPPAAEAPEKQIEPPLQVSEQAAPIPSTAPPEKSAGQEEAREPAQESKPAPAEAPASPQAPSPRPSPPGAEPGKRFPRKPLEEKPLFSLDERWGPRLALWVGAVALAFAAAFLVHYSWKKGWFTPALRVLSGLAMGLLLVGLGARLRKKNEKIAAALTAAGVADIYICIWAAASVWRLIPPGLGFAFLALTTAGAIVLSLHLGQIVLVLGLVGGYVTPLLVQAAHPRPEILFPYLFLLALGILVTTLRRNWIGPAFLSILAGQVWALGWIGLRFQPGQTLWVGGFLLLTSLAYLLPCLGREELPPWKSPYGPYIGRILALGGGILTLSILWWNAGYAPSAWILVLLLCIPALFQASRDLVIESWIAWAAMAMEAAALLLWRGWATGPGPGRLTLFAAGTGLFFGGLSYLLLWRARRPMVLSALVSASVLSFFAVLYVQLHGKNWFPYWWQAAAGLGLLLSWAAYPIYKKRRVLSQGNYALAGLAWGAVAGFCAALPLATSEIYITLGWALAVPLLVHLDLALEIPSLRYAAALLGAAAGARLLLNPYVMNYSLEGGSFFNWILFGYGLSALFFLETRRALKERALLLSRWFLGGTTVFLFYLVTLQIRHLHHPQGLARGGIFLAEWGAYSSAWLILGLVLLFWNRLRPDPVLAWGGELISILGLGTALLAQGLFADPLLSGDPVGSTPVFNLLLFLYGVPWILSLLHGRIRKEGNKTFFHPLLFRAGALVFFFLLLTLEVRHAFHGTVLKGPMPGGILLAEWGAYSSAWLLYGLFLLFRYRLRPDPVLERSGLILSILGLGTALLAQGFFADPLLSGDPVGSTPVFNLLLFLYGVPWLLCLLLGKTVPRRAEGPPLSLIFRIGALVFFFLLLNLEVRHAFHGTVLKGPMTGQGENYAYSAAWALFGLGLLGLGIRWKGKLLRVASLAVMALTVCKVFLFDTAHLGELYRVFSFLCLGVSLFLLAWLYQKYVFGESLLPALRKEPPPREGTSSSPGEEKP